MYILVFCSRQLTGLVLPTVQCHTTTLTQGVRIVLPQYSYVAELASETCNAGKTRYYLGFDRVKALHEA